MGKLSVQDKVCFLSFWALMLMYSAAEQGYFLQITPLPWDEARNHCQVCFKDLVTLTPTNIQTIARNLTSDYWIGLRKNFNSSSMPWTRWANKDPLTFQNWYPGWPVLESSSPERNCCSCSCTCPEMNISEVNTTSLFSFQPPLEATCMQTPMLLEDVDTEQNYTKDPCVAMLRFGAWVEKNCSEHLRFICYDDTFIGHVNVTSVTSTSANFTWLEAPGVISHYRVEVKGDVNLIENTNNLTFGFVHLTEGTNYSIQVFPVKCGRDLNPQEGHFYTLPNKVESVTVIDVTETSVYLSWSEPVGNLDFYRIKFLDKQISSSTADENITNLTPGSLYTFSVYSGVNNSTLSDETNITVYTKPGKVTNLFVSDKTKHSLLLDWDPPKGGYTGFFVTAENENNVQLSNATVTESKLNVTKLPMCSMITISVTALANGTLKGDKVTVVNNTEPEPISSLTLEAGFSVITAKWDSPGGKCSSFTVKLQLDGKIVETENLTQPTVTFDSLETASNYTVIVYSVSGPIMSLPVAASKYTLPLMPTNLRFKALNKTYVNFMWTAPNGTTKAKYQVNIASIFWNQNWTVSVDEKTSLIVGPLKSGTKYEFKIQTVADILSNPAHKSYNTVADLREISLSMLCSSEVSLLCDNEITKGQVFEQLKGHFYNLLKDYIKWDLEPVTGNPGA